MNTPNFKQIISDLLKLKGVTQVELARQVAEESGKTVSQGNLGDWLRERSRPKYECASVLVSMHTTEMAKRRRKEARRVR